MSYLKWTMAYSVDVPEIDEQHKRLFALVNDLHHAMKTGKDKDLARIIDAVVDYTDYHFKAEEELLRSCAYPEFDEHKEMHDSLTRRARHMKEAFESGNTQRDRGDAPARELAESAYTGRGQEVQRMCAR